MQTREYLNVLANRFVKCDKYGNGHIVFDGGNVEDNFIDFCLNLELPNEERQLLLELKQMPLFSRYRVYILARKLQWSWM